MSSKMPYNYCTIPTDFYKMNLDVWGKSKEPKVKATAHCNCVGSNENFFNRIIPIIGNRETWQDVPVDAKNGSCPHCEHTVFYKVVGTLTSALRKDAKCKSD